MRFEQKASSCFVCTGQGNESVKFVHDQERDSSVSSENVETEKTVIDFTMDQDDSSSDSSDQNQSLFSDDLSQELFDLRKESQDANLIAHFKNPEAEEEREEEESEGEEKEERKEKEEEEIDTLPCISSFQAVPIREDATVTVLSDSVHATDHTNDFPRPHEALADTVDKVNDTTSSQDLHGDIRGKKRSINAVEMNECHEQGVHFGSKDFCPTNVKEPPSKRSRLKMFGYGLVTGVVTGVVG